MQLNPAYVHVAGVGLGVALWTTAAYVHGVENSPVSCWIETVPAVNRRVIWVVTHPETVNGMP
jgi:hypothetical protein